MATMEPSGNNNYCMRVVIVGALIACMAIYLLYYLYETGIVDKLIRFLSP